MLLDQYDISLPDFPQIDWSSVSTEWERFKSGIPEPWKLANDGREFRVGDEMRARGLEAKFPVILIPGIISTVSRAQTVPLLATVLMC
jgi:phospholipid:diacylglycerol acyltransferase